MPELFGEVIVDSESKGESRNIYLHIKSEKYRLIIKGKPELHIAILEFI